MSSDTLAAYWAIPYEIDNDELIIKNLLLNKSKSVQHIL